MEMAAETQTITITADDVQGFRQKLEEWAAGLDLKDKAMLTCMIEAAADRDDVAGYGFLVGTVTTQQAEAAQQAQSAQGTSGVWDTFVDVATAVGAATGIIVGGATGGPGGAVGAAAVGYAVARKMQ
jgi:hypothetical protein